ncbi:hypothetical protein CQ13_31170 [Bradyrhizobium retamae]|uniref:Uncharacterized protein n=1 Tax=Bradyrhizobium retamae TaxID=1300035 RepID=A0A0R3ML78_9BRAD|nr:hypothetical protein CQ13_31170 [Bradyrhizobium retamae]
MWAILLILVFPAYCLAGGGKSITITVAADHTKANGEPWDGIPGLGGGRGRTAIPLPNKNAPPDLAVCVVRLETPPECSMRYVNLKQYSLCQNSFACVFKRVSIPDGPFGLIILDLDLRRHDLVSFLLITAGKALTPDQRAALESEIRRRADQLAPPFLQGEKQRRSREMLVVSVDRCAEAKGCRLVPVATSKVDTGGKPPLTCRPDSAMGRPSPMPRAPHCPWLDPETALVGF